MWSFLQHPFFWYRLLNTRGIRLCSFWTQDFSCSAIRAHQCLILLPVMTGNWCSTHTLCLKRPHCWRLCRNKPALSCWKNCSCLSIKCWPDGCIFLQNSSICVSGSLTRMKLIHMQLMLLQQLAFTQAASIPAWAFSGYTDYLLQSRNTCVRFG